VSHGAGRDQVSHFTRQAAHSLIVSVTSSIVIVRAGLITHLS
jgi:hypothetical protein